MSEYQRALIPNQPSPLLPACLSSLCSLHTDTHTSTPTFCVARAMECMKCYLMTICKKLHEHAKTSVNVLSLVKWAPNIQNEHRCWAHFKKRREQQHRTTHRSNFEIDVINFKQTAKQKSTPLITFYCFKNFYEFTVVTEFKCLRIFLLYIPKNPDPAHENGWMEAKKQQKWNR